MTLKAPFPYFGGKSKVASIVWERFGDVPNYVEPFFGSGAVLLARPTVPKTETVNDADALLSNFWRSVQNAPEEVIAHADWPVSEVDLHARHLWLVNHRLDVERMMADPELYDTKAAGWWVWGVSQWIGSGWCSGEGPWSSVNGILARTSSSLGIYKKRPQLGNFGNGVHAPKTDIPALIHALSQRLRRVRICCGDWSRVTGFSPTTQLGLTGVFLDPPYSNDERAEGLYVHDAGSVAADARAWAIEHGEDPKMRIALCGYDTEHTMPDTWEAYSWKANGGLGNQGVARGRENALREVVWFSPHCVR